MEKLEIKFAQEVNDDTRIVACRFPLPNWEPVQTIGSGIDTVWLYKKHETETSLYCKDKDDTCSK